MASTINATNTSSGIALTPDSSGVLALQAAGTTVATLNSSGVNAGIQVAANAAPAFSAYQSSAQAVTASTFTKLQLQTKEFDTNTNFDATTNYRFTPTVAGYYQVNGAFQVATTASVMYLAIYKNGAVYKIFSAGGGSATLAAQAGSALVFLNGSTDYVELYGYASIAQNTLTGIQNTYFQASFVRSA